MKHRAIAIVALSSLWLACVPVPGGAGLGAAWPAAGSGCDSDERCADGLVCEALTEEMLAAYLMTAGLDELPAGVPLPAGESVCQPGCRIGRLFQTPTESDPVSGGCQVCDPSVSTTTWTPASTGSACDDGLYCTSSTGQPGDSDVCDGAGACTGQAVNCDDGLYCTGVESCNEDDDRCDSSGDPCPSTECHACQESTGSCLVPAGTACGDPRDTTCDDPDSCDGAGVCQPNHAPSDTICRVAARFCDQTETCDGRGRCPDDRGKANGTACDDGSACTANDTCQGGGCIGGPPPPELCDGADADCDGLVDCDDSDCATAPACLPVIGYEPVPSTCSNSNQTCDAEVVVPFRVDGGAPPGSLMFELSFDAGADGSVDDALVVGDVLGGAGPDYVVTATFPIGSHALRVDVEDGSGNTDSATIPFEVVDCRAPTPICINGLAIELMPVEPNTDADGDGDIDAGAFSVSAIDFIASPATDCSEPIRYSINYAGGTPDIDRSSLVMTCDDYGTTLVEVHGWDAAGNHDFCETYVIVQDNMFNLCSP